MGQLIPFIRDVLSRLKEAGFPEVLAAGGALRDWDNGHGSEVKDIDVFVKDRQGYLAALIGALPGFVYRLAVPVHVAQYMQFEGVVAVHEFISVDHPEMPPVQIVVMHANRSSDHTTIISRHDFGICQIGFDGNTLVTTPAYEEDHMNQTFTLVRCRDEKDLKRSMKRWERLSQKYTGWILRMPNEDPLS